MKNKRLSNFYLKFLVPRPTDFLWGLPLSIWRYAAFSLHIRRETVWKLAKKLKETGVTCNRPRPRQKTNSPNVASVEKYEGNVEKEFTFFCFKNGFRSKNQSNFNASNPQRRHQNLSFRDARIINLTFFMEGCDCVSIFGH